MRGRIARDHGTVATGASAVVDDRQPAVLTDLKTVRIRDCLTIRKHLPLQLPSEEALSAYLSCIKVLIPFEQVFEGRHHTALPDDVVVPNVDPPVTLRRRAVRRRPAAHRYRVIVVEVGRRHAERTKDSFSGELGERLSAHSLH